MPNFYVSARRGSDATGTGTAANPWKTIGKAIGASPAITLSAATRLYVEPGTYYEAVPLGLAPTATNTLEIIGDCDGAGFLAGGFAQPATGVVDWSAWTSDSSASSAPCLTGGDKSYVTLRSLKLHGGSTGGVGSCVQVTTGTDWRLADCIFAAHAASSQTVNFTTAGAGLNLTVDRCDFHVGCQFGAIGLRIAAAETASEYSIASSVTNCRFLGSGGSTSRGIRMDRTANTGLGAVATGLTVRSCTFVGLTAGIVAYDFVTATAAPNTVQGCLFLRCERGVQAGAASQLVEDRNAFHCTTARVNVAAGANSSASLRPGVDLGDGLLVGVPLRPFYEPTAGSPLGGFVASGFPDVDRTNRPRPEGFGSPFAAAGCLERHDTGEPDATCADIGSPACLALRGPASLERPILVDPVTTSIRVKVRWDGLHGDAAKPQAILLANPEIGVAAGQVLTASSSGGSGETPNAYETLSFAPFTPSRAGVVMLRMVSRPAAGTGTAYFDSITLS